MSPKAKAKSQPKAKSVKKAPTKKAKSKKDSDDESTEEEKKRSKFTEHPDAVDDLATGWKEWRREHTEWARQATTFDELTMITSMLRHLTAEQKSVIYSQAPDGCKSIKQVYGILQREFGTDSYLDQLQCTRKFRAYRRNGDSLRNFLLQYNKLRHEAVASGMEATENATDEDGHGGESAGERCTWTLGGRARTSHFDSSGRS